MSRRLFWLNDEQWVRIKPHLPTDVRGKPRVDDRRVVSGIVHVLRSGCRWCDCPEAYGPPTTIYNRFVRCVCSDITVKNPKKKRAGSHPPAFRGNGLIAAGDAGQSGELEIDRRICRNWGEPASHRLALPWSRRLNDRIFRDSWFELIPEHAEVYLLPPIAGG